MPTSRTLSAMAVMAAGLLGSAAASAAVAPADVLKSYADVAEATYADSRIAAESLLSAVRNLVATPNDAAMQAARAAWLASRVPYMQSEGFRFGNAIVDDWEGKVNAWPLDEGLIDYVDGGSYGASSDENPGIPPTSSPIRNCGSVQRPSTPPASPNPC